MVEVRIEKTQKLGSMKETLGFIKDAAKELANYQAALTRESMKFCFNTIRKGMQIYKIVEKLTKQGEGPLSSPDIVYHGEKYWVIAIRATDVKSNSTEKYSNWIYCVHSRK